LTEGRCRQAAPRARRYVNIATGDLDLHFLKARAGPAQVAAQR
jgi:hypothetical protein